VPPTGLLPSSALTSPLRLVGYYIAGRPWSFLCLLGLIVGAGGCAAAAQYTMKLLVDGMNGGDPAGSARIAAVSGPLMLFLGLIATENVFWRTSGWLGCRTIVGVGADMRLDLFRHLAGHSMRYFADHLAGSLGSRITAAASSFGTIASSATWNIAPPCIEFIGAVVIFTTVDWRMAATLVLLVTATVAGLALFGKRGQTLHRFYAGQANRAGGEIVDTVANIWAVKAFAGRERERQRLALILGTEAAAQRRSWMYLEKTRVIHDACLWLMAGGMLWWAVHLWSDGVITAGDVVVVSAMTFRILHGARDLALAMVAMGQHLGTLSETLSVIGQPHAVADPPNARPLINLGGSIHFEDVTFSHAGGNRVLDGFNLWIPAGQRVGIVGSSGAGKSTIIALILRLHDVQRGRVLIDGQPVTSVTQDSLQDRVAVVPQEISLFHRSILENIRYGRPEASDAEVIAAARAARCDEFIRALPDGYETIVGERGAKLSGGQRQRIGIARALLKDAPILLLDEASSALDTETEREVQLALAELGRGRTVIAIAHRLSTLNAYDRILVLEDGRITEDGPPADLRRKGGAFEALWRSQAG
jgi:ATP-binding cassette, subfamily B, bacterial